MRTPASITDLSTDEFRQLPWQDKAYWASQGRLRAIIVNALGFEPVAGEPAFLGRPTVTSDGFLICNFRTAEGDVHMGAFAGAAADVARNVRGLANHTLDDHARVFSSDEQNALYVALAPWTEH